MNFRNIAELFDFDRLPYAKNHRSYMASSYDREGGNFDWGNYEQVMGLEGVVLDVDGPGIITRIWSANPGGEIKLYLDGNTTPVVQEPFEQFLKRLPLHWGEGHLNQGTPEIEAAMADLKPLGHTVYCPIAFNKGCKMVLSPVPQVYYQVNYLLCDAPHGLSTFSADLPQRAANDYVHILERMGKGRSPKTGGTRTTGCCALEPGAKGVIFDQAGPLTIQAIKVRLSWPQNAAAARHMQDKLLLRAYWDNDLLIEGLPGHRKPSVKSPLAAFFMDFGAFDSYETAAISKRGTEYTCRFPMPVGKRAVIELVNGSCLGIDKIEYEIEYAADIAWNEDVCHFKAVYHCEDSTFGYDLGNYRDDVMYLRNRSGHHNYPLLRAYGKGHFVGCCFHADFSETPYSRAGGEADEAVFVDDDPDRTMWGTGNEDYVNDAWGFHRVITPLSGGQLLPGDAFFGYRFHISDCIPFSRKLDFTLEHGSSNNCTGHYRSVAYYYLKETGKNIFVNDVPLRKMNRYFEI